MNAAELKAIIENPAASADNRAAAIRELEAREPKSPRTKTEEHAVELCGRLGLELLKFSGARELSETTWRDLVRFTDLRDWPGKWENHDIRRLWSGWVLFGNGGILTPYPRYYKQSIWDAIKEEFATDQERRAEFIRVDGLYPLFSLAASDDPYELQNYERNLESSDRALILNITRKKLDEAPEYWFRTREIAQRIIEKLTERK